MINSSAMGLIFPNTHDENIPELSGNRTMASIPFAGRYRMIDFAISGMAGAGIQSIGVVVKRNYQSLMDHIGTGREWDLSSKRGGMVIFPPYAREGTETYSGYIEGIASILSYIEGRREDLVVISDCDIAFSLDYKHLIRTHKATGADVTVVYHRAPILEGMEKDNVAFGLDADGRVDELRVNEYKKGPHNLGLNVYVIGRDFLVSVVREAMVKGERSFLRDFMTPNLSRIKVLGYAFGGYAARIYNMPSYYRESLRLLDYENLSALFPTERPVLTKVRDEAPVRYGIGARVAGCLVADGCIIEGEVENCVLFRGVRVRKGARLKDCVVMQGSEIEQDVEMQNVVTDKNVRVCSGQKLRGAASFPVFIAKGCTVM